MSFGALFFAAPLALLAFLAVPALLWLIRATPPAPALQAFPPLRFLLGLTSENSQRLRAPWWLLLLRALLASLLILGFAQPSWRPETAPAPAAGPVLIVLDDGWTSAPEWAAARAAALGVIEEAEKRQSGPFHVLATAPQRAEPGPIDALSATEIKARINGWRPSAWRPDRAGTLNRLTTLGTRFIEIAWISDGLGSQGADDLGKALSQLGPLRVYAPAFTARAITDLRTTTEGLEIDVRRAANGNPVGAVAAETLQGRALGAAEIRFAPSATEYTARIALPPAIAARAARVRLVGEGSAGAVRLAPNGAGRPVVGLVNGADTAQPLVSDRFYVERAIQPFASIQRGEIEALIAQNVQALVLVDDSALPQAAQGSVLAWLDKGGLIIRFAGPRLANADQPLAPSPLRRGARALGGALTWEQPQQIAAFPPESPFAGLAAPPNVRVRRQVLADPAGLAQAQIWARLQDGTPVVTAAPRGRGLLVLFHVTAGPAWSDLALSGLFVDMLRETLSFAGSAASASEAKTGLAPWQAALLFDGFGALAPPQRRVQIADDVLAGQPPGPAVPPGLYERDGSPQRAISAASQSESLVPLRLPANASWIGKTQAGAISLSGILLAIAALLGAADLVLALALAGSLKARPRTPIAAAALMALLIWTNGARPALAQINVEPPPGWGINVPLAPPEIAGIGDVRLAFIRTGDGRLDRATRAGLEALSATLFERTAVEPGPVVMLDPARDDLSQFPLLFWVAPAQPTPLSAAAAANVERYMQLGGLLFIDTRGLARASANQTSPAAILLQGIDAPPLEVVNPREHVLGKAFYLFRSFGGRQGSATLWAESAGAAAARDGVASLIIGDGDWVSSWADDQQGQPGSGNSRELALRFGVNLVMMALTGNYKADQVHLSDLLARIGKAPGNTR